MARWPRGEAEIERLLGLGHLQAITGAAADGEPLLANDSRRPCRGRLGHPCPVRRRLPRVRLSSPTS